MSLSVPLATSSQSEGATCSVSRWGNRTCPIPSMLPPSPHPPMGLTSNNGMCPLPFKLEPSGFMWHTFFYIFFLSLTMMLLVSVDAVCSSFAFVVERSVVRLHPTFLSVVAQWSSVQWQCKASCHGAYCSSLCWCADVHTAIECVPRSRVAQSQGHS